MNSFSLFFFKKGLQHIKSGGILLSVAERNGFHHYVFLKKLLTLSSGFDSIKKSP